MVHLGRVASPLRVEAHTTPRYHRRVTTRTRLETLEEFARNRPADAFAHYGLAMEYLKLERFDESIATFRALIAFAPLYTPAYYHASRALLAAGRRAEAEQMIRSGMRACDEKGDAHTKEELAALLAAGA
jgi:tetratricopeptide (TPR) repeat protein